MSQLPIRIIFGKEIIRLAEDYDYYAVCADTKCCSFEDFGDIIRNVRFQLESLNKI